MQWIITTATRSTAEKKKHTSGSARLAWVLWGVSLVLAALGVLLVALNSHSDVAVFDYWLETTLSALVFSPVGA
jgi:hypothetical protein